MISPRHDHHWVLFRLLLAAGWLLILGGCGRNDGREMLEGSVAIDGKPLESGYILFRSSEAGKSQATGANIAAGTFRIAGKRSVQPGKFRVEITASRNSGQKTADQLTGKPVDAIEQFIPARYNSQSELTADVKAGGANQFEFKITSK